MRVLLLKALPIPFSYLLTRINSGNSFNNNFSYFDSSNFGPNFGPNFKLNFATNPEPCLTDQSKTQRAY